jgi:hypothetical protein
LQEVVVAKDIILRLITARLVLEEDGLVELVITLVQVVKLLEVMEGIITMV